MATTDERLADLETKVADHTPGMSDVMGRKELSGRIDALDQTLDRRVDTLDQKVERFREELSSRLTWVAGVQMAMLVAMVGGMMSILLTR